MADPIEDGGANSALNLASVVDATFNSPPDDGPSSQSSDQRGAQWAAWVRDILTLALENLEKGGPRVGVTSNQMNNRHPVDKEAIKAAKLALESLAPNYPPDDIKRNRVSRIAAAKLEVP